MVRPSDEKEVRKLAFIQCAGSRDCLVDRGYCSSVCCMYTTKQSLIAKEHLNSIEPTIFYIDIRAVGKDFERYYQNAEKKHGVRYVRGLVSGIREKQRSKNLLLRYLDEAGCMQEEEFDLVVLSIGLGAPRASPKGWRSGSTPTASSNRIPFRTSRPPATGCWSAGPGRNPGHPRYRDHGLGRCVQGFTDTPRPAGQYAGTQRVPARAGRQR